ncbi:MAG: biotin synthase BioB [Thermodesulfobacteriota bacterium]|nr:biotin synthase BioB [Thermodesulfobacteriota bacterium]
MVTQAMLHPIQLTDIARRIQAGDIPDDDTLLSLIRMPDDRTFLLFPGADLLREHFFGTSVHLCVICNGKSGRCSEDCAFCSQSVRARAGIDAYPLMSETDLAEPGRRLESTPVNRYSVVTSGRGLSSAEVSAVSRALAAIDTTAVSTCASLGILDPGQLAMLRDTGVTRYHHNLESAESFFANVCTTHTYEERVQTVKAAKAAGLSVCCGGIFGLGETDDQVAELAFALRDLDVDSVPVNFLVPIRGTALEAPPRLSPLRCLRIIAFLRHVLPDKEIIVCGGRVHNLGELHPLVFYAGASGVMTGDYLTTSGRNLADDLALINTLGMTPRAK